MPSILRGALLAAGLLTCSPDGLSSATAAPAAAGSEAASLAAWFESPPEEARPWVYWYFMDGNLAREGMTADLESMKRVGIGGGIFLEVDLGIPRGPVGFMSEPWKELLGHAARESERLGLELSLGSGPGWCGTGGPWVKPEQSMQHLVASETRVAGPRRFTGLLPRPAPRTPFFGEGTFTPETKRAWQEFHRDVAVLAFPTPRGSYRIPDVDEKALFHRAPYSSAPNVKPRLASDRTVLPADECIPPEGVVDLTPRMRPDGTLDWDVPNGDWTILRLGRTLTGQITRPAPRPGLGFESDKFDTTALDAHFNDYVANLLKTVGEPKGTGRGFTTLHFDSWEMSSQNWSAAFREEFRARRRYDPLPYLPAMFGRAVGSVAMAERFLWDLRRTAQELVLEKHVVHLKELGRRHGMGFSAEPYDMNPAGDLLLGGVADVPMCEFWSAGLGFATEYSCFEAVSAAHTNGRRIVGAEAFTSTHDQWRQYPGSMKQQGDWAFCAGINRFVFHRFQHQPTLDQAPGMTFGYTHGVHWERTQTWWELSGAYHRYLARCQSLLRQGLPVADVLYLDVEDAPAVFTPPPSALLPGLPDRRGHGFDGCAPDTLIARGRGQNGQLVFPDGMTYRLLVLPRSAGMTPALARKLAELTAQGVPVLGHLPERAPGLQDYPDCDRQVRELAQAIRNSPNYHPDPRDAATDSAPGDLYPDYAAAARILAQRGVPPDFESTGDLRYVRRTLPGTEIYFVGNRTDHAMSATARFRVTGLRPELWDPLTGARRPLPEFREAEGRTTLPLRFAPGQSHFVVFRAGDTQPGARTNFPEHRPWLDLSSDWEVTFDPRRGGPERAVPFPTLVDWTRRPEDGIRHYSGIATYRRTFDAPPREPAPGRQTLELGAFPGLAGVELNGRDLGGVWCAPHATEIPPGLLKPTGNEIRIRVANLWPNRLIKDAGLPEEARVARTTWNPYKPGTPLLPSGLVGPIRITVEAPESP